MDLFIFSIIMSIVLLLLWRVSFQDKRIDGLTDKVGSLSKRKIIGVSTNYQSGFNKVAARMTEEEWGKDEANNIDVFV